MATFRRKDGEKATLLSKCGKSLFGCSGETFVTQGIYAPKSESGSFQYFCKRAVWVPVSLSYEHFIHNLESFGATLPFSVQKVASFHRFGLCGINPTRAGHAIDQQFLLLAKVPHKHFVVYGIVEIRQTSPTSIVYIESITTSKDDILDCVNWMKSELTLHNLSKGLKTQRLCFPVSTGDTSEKEGGKVIESEPQKAVYDPTQHKGVETESETSIHTPEYSNCVSHECVVPQNVNGSHLSNPSIVYWISCLPSQCTVEATGQSTPFFIAPQPSSSFRPQM